LPYKVFRKVTQFRVCVDSADNTQQKRRQKKTVDLTADRTPETEARSERSERK